MEDAICHMPALIDELQNCRPIPPTPLEPEQLNGDKEFCYICQVLW